jgi:hypothetical protein
MPSLKDIEERQERLQAKAMSLINETDGQRIMELAEEMRREALELEDVALAFEAEMAAGSRQARGAFEVVLTPAQRQRVKTETGVTMESVLIDDPSGALNAAMVETRPELIEIEALRQARERAQTEPAKAAARELAENLLADIEAQGEAFAEQVRELRQDPKFQQIMDFDKKLK